MVKKLIAVTIYFILTTAVIFAPVLAYAAPIGGGG